MTKPGGDLRIQRARDGVAFWIHVTPRSRLEGVGGTYGDALRVAVRSPPVEGKANRACVEALAEALGIARAAVELDPGSRGRRKRVRVKGDADALERALRRLAAGGSMR